MPRWLPQITAIALALHTLLGCCWHHAHGNEGHEAVACEGHNHDDHSPVDHDHKFDCNESVCSFVKGDQTNMLPTISANPVAVVLDVAISPATSSAETAANVSWPPSVTAPHFLCAMLRC